MEISYNIAQMLQLLIIWNKAYIQVPLHRQNNLYIGIYMHLYLHPIFILYTHVKEINEKKAMDLKENKEDYIGEFERRKEQKELCDYIIIPKCKIKMKI